MQRLICVIFIISTYILGAFAESSTPNCGPEDTPFHCVLEKETQGYPKVTANVNDFKKCSEQVESVRRFPYEVLGTTGAGMGAYLLARKHLSEQLQAKTEELERLEKLFNANAKEALLGAEAGRAILDGSPLNSGYKKPIADLKEWSKTLNKDLPETKEILKQILDLETKTTALEVSEKTVAEAHGELSKLFRNSEKIKELNSMKANERKVIIDSALKKYKDLSRAQHKLVKEIEVTSKQILAPNVRAQSFNDYCRVAKDSRETRSVVAEAISKLKRIPVKGAAGVVLVGSIVVAADLYFSDEPKPTTVNGLTYQEAVLSKDVPADSLCRAIQDSTDENKKRFDKAMTPLLTAQKKERDQQSRARPTERSTKSAAPAK